MGGGVVTRDRARSRLCMCAAVLLFGVAGLACKTGSESEGIQTAARRARSPQTERDCTPAVPAGSAKPEDAFRGYAESVNARRWCEAISAFEPASRAAVAVASFKGLALSSVSDSPHKQGYLDELLRLSSAYKLGVDDEFEALALGIAAMHQTPELQERLKPVRSVVQSQAVELYVAIMTAFQRVDSAALVKLEPGLASVSVTGDAAVADTTDLSGKPSRVEFRRSQTGWILSMP